MKHEWKKHEKNIYLPKATPEIIDIPTFRYFTIEGACNSDAFAEYIGVLYTLAYGVKMSSKKGIAPDGYFEYTVYPLEGVWDITDEAKKNFSGTINKDDLVFKLMIRQPEFVNDDFANRIVEITKKKKPHPLLEKVKFEALEEGRCVQMLHIGSYDSEPASFAIMEKFATENGLTRTSKIHKEIYLSDARKVAPEKLKTILRFKAHKTI